MLNEAYDDDDSYYISSLLTIMMDHHFHLSPFLFVIEMTCYFFLSKLLIKSLFDCLVGLFVNFFFLLLRYGLIYGYSDNE